MDWSRLSADDPREFVAQQILQLLWTTDSPWKTIDSVKPDVALIVIDVLQTELDAGPSNERYRTTCMKCLRVLGKHHDIVPTSFFCRNVRRDGAFPVSGGGFADIWKGTMEEKPVCLKVLRLFLTGSAREELLKDFCHEALVWRQLRHPNVLPFLGVTLTLCAPSFCLISPWMENGNIISFLQRYPSHDRLKAICEIAQGIRYLHELDPQIVHGDIRGANILVNNELRCCLADFGLSLVAESQTPASSAMVLRGSIRWLPPEMMDYSLFDHSRVAAKDIYSFGCTIIEIYTGKAPFWHIRSDAALINEVLTLKNKPPRPSADELPSDELWALIESCLSSSPKDRPTATTVLGQLRIMNGFCSTCPDDSPGPYVYQRVLATPSADAATPSGQVPMSSADLVIIRVDKPLVGNSTSRRPSLTLNTRNLVPSNNSSPDSSTASSTSHGRLSDSTSRLRPKGPRSPSTAGGNISPDSAQSEHGPTHTKFAVTPPTPMDNIAPLLSPVTPLCIKKRVDTTRLLPPKTSSKNRQAINGLFKAWASKPGDVVVKSLPKPVFPPFKWVRGVPIAVGAYSQISFALNAAVGEVMVVKQVEIPANREQSLHHRASRMIKHMYEMLKDLKYPNVVRCLGLELNTSGASLSVFPCAIPHTFSNAS
ncbi:kinase-like domain-containing protein [Mucidula mucida]|nr:kinase-like domain-containing protein [Mucidula mucida]